MQYHSFNMHSRSVVGLVLAATKQPPSSYLAAPVLFISKNAHTKQRSVNTVGHSKKIIQRNLFACFHSLQIPFLCTIL